MRWWQLALLVALVVVPMLPLTFGVWYEHVGGPDRLTVWLRLFGLLRLQYAVPLVRGQLTEDLIERLPPGGPDAWLAAARERLLWFGRFGTTARYLMSAVFIRRLSLAVEFGTGDAALTGLTAGAIWAVFGSSRCLVPGLLRFARGEPRLFLTPRFDRTGLRIRFSCIFSLRVGHIIVAGSKLVRLSIKGVTAWRASTPFRG
ncbi:MAG: DUF2953 domain-containing protein [Chloroflexota bacterium]